MKDRTLDATARELREAIARAKGGRRNGVVPGELRARALALLDVWGREGAASRRGTAAALGIHETTLVNWRREAAARTPFAPARVVVEGAPSAEWSEPSPAVPAGVRVMIIDGLDAATLASLLRSTR